MTDETAPVQTGKFSFDGYAFGIWMSKNKDEIKKDVRYIILALVTLLSALQTGLQPSAWQAGLIVVSILVLNFVSKWGLDALDYWVTSNPQ